MKIVLADDERGIHCIIKRVAENEGYELVSVYDGLEALAAINRENPDLVILDVMMPGMDGFQVCRKLRAQGSIVPVIFLSARGDIVDKGTGFDAGGDDYMVKPFSPEELAMRIAAHVRRQRRTLESEHDDVIEYGDVVIDVRKRKVFKCGEQLDFTPKEFDILTLLAVNKGEILTRDSLTEQVWGENYVGETLGVAVYIRRIREKIEDNPSKPIYIQTVWREGYRFGD